MLSAETNTSVLTCLSFLLYVETEISEIHIQVAESIIFNVVKKYSVIKYSMTLKASDLIRF